MVLQILFQISKLLNPVLLQSNFAREADYRAPKARVRGIDDPYMPPSVFISLSHTHSLSPLSLSLTLSSSASLPISLSLSLSLSLFLSSLFLSLRFSLSFSLYMFLYAGAMVHAYMLVSWCKTHLNLESVTLVRWYMRTCWWAGTQRIWIWSLLHWAIYNTRWHRCFLSGAICNTWWYRCCFCVARIMLKCLLV